MDEDIGVSQIGQQYGRTRHRETKIERCANGYIVEYQIVNPNAPTQAQTGNFLPEVATLRETRVFICNDDLRRFLDEYFPDEPRP